MHLAVATRSRNLLPLRAHYRVIPFVLRQVRIDHELLAGRVSSGRYRRYTAVWMARLVKFFSAYRESQVLMGAGLGQLSLAMWSGPGRGQGVASVSELALNFLGVRIFNKKMGV